MEKQKWIEEVFRSTQEIQRAEAPEGLWAKIQQEIQQEVKIIAMVPQRTVWLAAASVAVLILLNWMAVRSYDSTKPMSAIETIMAEYQLNSENLPLP